MHHIDEADDTIRDARVSETTDGVSGHDERQQLALILGNAVTMPATLPADVREKAERLIGMIMSYLKSERSEAELVRLQSPGRLARRFRECVATIEQSAEIPDRKTTLAAFHTLVRDLWKQVCKGDKHLLEQMFPKDVSSEKAK